MAGTQERHPIIAYANYAALRPGQRIGPLRVQSRMLLWCRGGRGQVRVNGDAHTLNQGRYLILPWDHEIRYDPEAGGNWRLAGIHVIPDAAVRGPFCFEVSHVHRGEPHRFPDRHDDPHPGLTGVIAGSFHRARPLELLATYIVEWFLRRPNESEARALATLLLAEMLRAAQEPVPDEQALPGALRRILARIDKRLEQPLGISELADAGGCSLSTLHRLFRRSLGMTVSRWIGERRMERAAALLAETDLPLAEVGRRAGIADPYYFSRLFRKIRGLTASEHRRRSGML